MKTVSNGERNSRRLRIWELALLIGLAVFLLTGALSLRSQDQLADKVVRLHVLANSDSEEDQALKLKVRDRVLERATELLEQAADRREAEALLRGQLLELEEIAAEEIAANGYDYPVSVELEPTQFPTKEYDGFSLPAGSYRALRVVLGEGDGRNWWCVVFPPLCLSSVTEVADTALAAGLGEEDVRLITGESGGYVVKFKCIELWEEFQGWLAGEAG